MTELNKTYEMVFRRMVKETDEIYSFIFEKPEDLEWKPGQHGIFRNMECKVEGDKNYRIFSFASIMEEDFVMFSTRITDESTDCKKKLLELKPGDRMTAEDPQGRFRIQDFNKPTCMIAGGIGITPIRALLQSMDLKCINPVKLRVLYSDDRGEFAYQDTLKWLNRKYDGLQLKMISDRHVFMEEIEAFAKEMRNNADYMISGTPGMNKAITDKLLSLGVEKTNIKTDNFIGYK
ncbi:MAG: FAD-dependent oxidoreductase [Bacillota bacterium]